MNVSRHAYVAVCEFTIGEIGIERCFLAIGFSREPTSMRFEVFAEKMSPKKRNAAAHDLYILCNISIPVDLAKPPGAR